MANCNILLCGVVSLLLAFKITFHAIHITVTKYKPCVVFWTGMSTTFLTIMYHCSWFSNFSCSCRFYTRLYRPYIFKVIFIFFVVGCSLLGSMTLRQSGCLRLPANDIIDVVNGALQATRGGDRLKRRRAFAVKLLRDYQQGVLENARGKLGYEILQNPLPSFAAQGSVWLTTTGSAPPSPNLSYKPNIG